MASGSAKKLASGQRNQWLKTLSQSAVNTEAGNHKVTIDTNIWVSGLLYGGPPEKVIRFCRQNSHIVLSPYILNELISYLKTIGAPYRWRNSLEKILKGMCELVEPNELENVSRDPRDDPVLATALAGRCDYLITGDQDLLALSTYGALRIISAVDFLALPKVKKHSGG